MRIHVGPIALACIALAACAGSSHGPAWPKPYVATDAHDGGESLAPHLPPEVAAIEASEDDTPATPVVAAPTAITPTVTAPTVTTPVTPTATEEPPTVEEMTIEVDD